MKARWQHRGLCSQGGETRRETDGGADGDAGQEVSGGRTGALEGGGASVTGGAGSAASP